MTVPLREIVSAVSSVCARFDHYLISDIESNLICRIWAQDIQFSSVLHVRRYALKCTMNAFQWTSRERRRTKLFSEMIGDTDDETPDWLDSIISPAPATQEITVDAKRVKDFARQLPIVHRKIVLILGDGGSVIDVAEELGLKPWDTLRYLAEIRTFFLTGNSITKLDKAA